MTNNIIVQRMIGVVILVVSVILTIGTGPWTNVKSSPLGNKATKSKEDFLCDNAKRISWHLKCNNEDDCKDGIGPNGSDELVCATQVPDVNTTETHSSSTGTIVLVTVGSFIALLVTVLFMYKCRSKIRRIPCPRYSPLCPKPRSFQNKIRGKVLPLLKVSKLKPSQQQQEQSPSNNGIPLQDVSPSSSSSSYKLIPENFVSVLEKVGEHPFAVYCMVGIPRSGKSYLLNFFKQSLSNTSQAAPEPVPAPAELEKNYSHQKIFKWQKGTKAKTVGIDIWSEPFFKDVQDGKRIAILLVDCEGFFGDERQMKENNVIFALSNIISSVVMANCRSETLTDTLRHLSDLSSYARKIDIGGDASEGQPPKGGQSQCQSQSQGQSQGQSQSSQKLVIMVRDFVNTKQFSYGYHDYENRPENSPENFYRTQFNTDNKNSEISKELNDKLDGILSSYKSVEFNLLPDPGVKFRLDPLNESPDSEFIRVRDETIELLLSPEYLVTVTKKLFNEEVTGKQFSSFVEDALDNIFKREISKFPDSDNFNDFLGEISYSKVYTAAHDTFIENLKTELENNGDRYTETEMNDNVIKAQLFKRICEEAVNNFTSLTLFRAEKTGKDCEKRLRDQCKITFENMMAEYRKTRILLRSSVVRGSSI